MEYYPRLSVCIKHQKHISDFSNKKEFIPLTYSVNQSKLSAWQNKTTLEKRPRQTRRTSAAYWFMEQNRFTNGQTYLYPGIWIDTRRQLYTAYPTDFGKYKYTEQAIIGIKDGTVSFWSFTNDGKFVRTIGGRYGHTYWSCLFWGTNASRSCTHDLLADGRWWFQMGCWVKTKKAGTVFYRASLFTSLTRHRNRNIFTHKREAKWFKQYDCHPSNACYEKLFPVLIVTVVFTSCHKETTPPLNWRGIRIENNSGIILEDASVANIPYGTIAGSQVTDYKKWTCLFTAVIAVLVRAVSRKGLDILFAAHLPASVWSGLLHVQSNAGGKRVSRPRCRKR